MAKIFKGSITPRYVGILLKDNIRYLQDYLSKDPYNKNKIDFSEYSPTIADEFHQLHFTELMDYVGIKVLNKYNHTYSEINSNQPLTYLEMLIMLRNSLGRLLPAIKKEEHRLLHSKRARQFLYRINELLEPQIITNPDSVTNLPLLTKFINRDINILTDLTDITGFIGWGYVHGMDNPKVNIKNIKHPRSYYWNGRVTIKITYQIPLQFDNSVASALKDIRYTNSLILKGTEYSEDHFDIDI